MAERPGRDFAEGGIRHVAEEQTARSTNEKIAYKDVIHNTIFIMETDNSQTTTIKAENRYEDVEDASEESSIPAFARAYYEAVGRRKTSIARVRVYGEGDKKVVVNGRELADYFPTDELRMIANGALRKVKVLDKFFVSANIVGGGIRGQAEAMRLGIARALVLYNPEFRQKLKRAGYLRRDAREVERKKFGLKKARRAPQWSKR